MSSTSGQYYGPDMEKADRHSTEFSGPAIAEASPNRGRDVYGGQNRQDVYGGQVSGHGSDVGGRTYNSYPEGADWERNTKDAPFRKAAAAEKRHIGQSPAQRSRELLDQGTEMLQKEVAALSAALEGALMAPNEEQEPSEMKPVLHFSRCSGGTDFLLQQLRRMEQCTEALKDLRERLDL